VTPEHQAAADLIPDFCRWRPLLLLAFTLELVAVVLTLAAGVGEDALGRFLLTSVFLQWVGFCSAAALCGTRRWLRHAPVALMFLASWTVLVAVIGLISAIGYEVLLRADAGFAAAPEPRYSFLFRHVSIGAIVSLLLLRLFWLQHQWRLQVLAEGRSRYEALQARIRPHFLFNSLNSIAALVGSRPDDAEALIEDMSELLRAGLDARSRLVPLADELALVRAYLRIEQARLRDRLAVEWDVAEDVTRLEVPLLSLQPLVENAIYHGVERLAGPGVVRVSARQDGGALAIEVANPVPAPGVAPHSGQRIAIDNIAQRLALIYGDDKARLELGEHGDRYVARLVLPVVTHAPAAGAHVRLDGAEGSG
jgi:two-component system, LytTR family, sensor histidine kinase AlgZ